MVLEYEVEVKANNKKLNTKVYSITCHLTNEKYSATLDKSSQKWSLFNCKTFKNVKEDEIQDLKLLSIYIDLVNSNEEIK